MGELNGKDTPSVVELQVIGAKNVAGALRTLHLHCGSKLAIISPIFATAAPRSANVPNTGTAALMALIASIFSAVVIIKKGYAVTDLFKNFLRADCSFKAIQANQPVPVLTLYTPVILPS